MIGWKHDANGSPIWRAHANPILDPWCYGVEFPYRKSTYLATNVITESMYGQGNNGNDFLLLNEMVDYYKNELTTEEQKIVTKGHLSLCGSTMGWKTFVQCKESST